MAHEVETMMYVRETPWHGLGVRVDEAPTSADAITLAGLDWTVACEPIYVKGEQPDDLSVVPDRWATVRQEDRQVLGVVGNQYQPIQNSEVFGFADALIDSGDLKYETAGSLREGRLVWALARLNTEIVINGDEHVPYLLLASGHDGGTPLMAMVTPVRVVCANTLRFAVTGADSTFMIRHTESADGKIQEARAALGISYEYIDAFTSEVQALQEQDVTDREFVKIVGGLVGLSDFDTDRKRVRKEEQREQILTVYRSSDTIDRGTGWGAVNAVNEWELWYRKEKDNGWSRQYLQADRFIRGAITPYTDRTVAALAKTR